MISCYFHFTNQVLDCNKYAKVKTVRMPPALKWRLPSRIFRKILAMLLFLTKLQASCISRCEEGRTTDLPVLFTNQVQQCCSSCSMEWRVTQYCLPSLVFWTRTYVGGKAFVYKALGRQSVRKRKRAGSSFSEYLEPMGSLGVEWGSMCAYWQVL
jgi:hypothetical protein